MYCDEKFFFILIDLQFEGFFAHLNKDCNVANNQYDCWDNKLHCKISPSKINFEVQLIAEQRSFGNFSHFGICFAIPAFEFIKIRIYGRKKKDEQERIVCF